MENVENVENISYIMPIIFYYYASFVDKIKLLGVFIEVSYVNQVIHIFRQENRWKTLWKMWKTTVLRAFLQYLQRLPRP